MHPPFLFPSFSLKITLHVSIPFVPQKFAWRGARKQGARKETIIAGREEGREAKSLCLCPAINRRKRRASRGVSFQPLRCLSMSVPPIADLYTTEIYCRAPSIRATYLRTFWERRGLPPSIWTNFSFFGREGNFRDSFEKWTRRR